jgi:hypothetical protein
MADLGDFSQLPEETEHFRGCSQQPVAKIVDCGENYSLVVEQEATREMPSSFCAIVRSKNLLQRVLPELTPGSIRIKIHIVRLLLEKWI